MYVASTEKFSGRAAVRGDGLTEISARGGGRWARFAASLLSCLWLAGCAVAAHEKTPLTSSYEPGREFEDKTVTLLGVGFFLAEPLLAPGLNEPEARLLLAAEALALSTRPENYASPLPSSRRILKTAFSQVGLPYRFGGSSPQTGFDCSGFVGWVYGQNGIKLPRSSPEMLAFGQAVPRPQLAPGDLVFFGRRQRVTHVGIYTGDNRYIHSPSRGKPVQESSLDDRARGEYYVGARRLLPDGFAAWNPAETPSFSPPLSESAQTLEAAAQAGAAAAPRLTAAPQQSKPRNQQNKTAAKKTSPRPAAKTHIVKAGDTLYDLARKYGLRAEDLARANNLTPKQKTTLRLGQVIAVPPKTAVK